MRTKTSGSTIVAAVATRWIVLAAALLTACGGGGGGGSGGPGPAPAAQGLSQFEDCEELRAAIVDNARQKIALQAERLREDGFHPVPIGGEPFPFPSAIPTASPAPGANAPPGRGTFTDTNTQVPDVDEADVVEADDTHLYLLHGSELVILDTPAPAATVLRARLAIEGEPTGMFVDGDRALVLSSLFDSGELGGADSCGGFGPPLPGVSFGRPTCPTPFTKATLVDVSADPPRVVGETYVEGFVVAARRHGDLARVVVRRSWGVPTDILPAGLTVYTGGQAPIEAEHVARVDSWERQAIETVEASTLEDWLPAHRERRDGTLVADTPACGDVHVPPPLESADGTTEIVTLSMSGDGRAAGDTVILGGADSVYANVDSLLLAQADWSWQERGEATDRTAVHVFALSPGSSATEYRASGFVPGVPISQFAFDVRDGVISVATTITSPVDFSDPLFDPLPPVSRVTSVRVEGDALAPVGATQDLAPGEHIVAVRFLGTRVYLVTFRFIDPLFVIDMADPAHPTLLGEVELPGFSTYLHPLDDTHLLTIGSDPDPENFFLSRVTLRIFDVTDPATPLLAHAHHLPGAGRSPAETNHLAFTYDADRGLVAVPYTQTDGPFLSSLFLIDVDAESGFAERGSIDHQSFATAGCPDGEPCAPFAEMQRGVFIGDAVYSISTAGVQVNTLAERTVLAQVPLPPPFLPPPSPVP